MTTPTGLEGKRVLVTGATGGIGSEICRVLHRDGARIAVHYGSSREQADALVAGGNGDSVAIQGDLTAPGGADAVWDAVESALGGIDVLVNNAGLWIPSPLEPAEEFAAGWQRNLDLNLNQAAWLSRRAVLHFESNGGGTIISLASRSSLRGDDIDHLGYGVAKAGLQNLMKGIARAYASRGVLAYSVAPAMVATKMIANVPAEHFAGLPLGEPVPPADVAETIGFLASGRARHMTGATLDITGADYVR